MATMQQTVIPQLRMTDAKRSLKFYVDKLGFEVDWVHQFEPGFPLFAQITRQGQTLFLTEHTGDCQVGGAVYFIVPDAAQCWSDFEQQGVVATNSITTMPWGTLEFLITDPDGNRLRFASALEKPA
ncbi:MAG: VOC family protein [Burkholderiales bacterium]|nr:VOC family protein [Burkholderiales bacterium]